ncbi:MAG: hypothetical protein IPM54_08670 [Polyangiaceae bacterium]|nr:hypothetical protein [Polyangiaceae bacterium]
MLTNHETASTGREKRPLRTLLPAAGIRLVVLFAVLSLGACSRESSTAATNAGSPSAPATSSAAQGGAAWLGTGTTDERFARVAKHLRGFDVAMAETGYRYGELYWAGQDENWDYAKYQAEKIRTTVRNGVERRPKRAQSAQMLDGAMRGIEEAITAKDPALFAERFDALTTTCNACHHAEQVAFVHIRRPTMRLSPVGPLPADAGAP